MNCIPLICFVYTKPRDFIIVDVNENVIIHNLRQNIKKYKFKCNRENQTRK